MRRGEMTIVIPGLEKSEAVELKREFMDLKNRVAPDAKASIAIGRRENFDVIAEKCEKRIGG